MVRQLLLRKPSLIDANRRGWSPLHYALERGEVEIVAQLLTAKPELVNEKAYNGMTPLHSAASLGIERVLELLLLVKPSLICERDKEGNTLLHQVLQRPGRFGHDLICKVWELDTIALFHCNRENYTPFHIAVLSRDDWAVDLLLPSLTFDQALEAFDFAMCGVGREKLCAKVRAGSQTLAIALHPNLIQIVYSYLFFAFDDFWN